MTKKIVHFGITVKTNLAGGNLSIAMDITTADELIRAMEQWISSADGCSVLQLKTKGADNICLAKMWYCLVVEFYAKFYKTVKGRVSFSKRDIVKSKLTRSTAYALFYFGITENIGTPEHSLAAALHKTLS